MKLKSIVGLVVILVLTLSLVFTSCMLTDTKWKATGGGWIEQCDSKVTFGFNAQPTDDCLMAKGQFQLVEHSKGSKPVRIHGSFVFTGMVLRGTEDEIAMYVGECSINGVEGNILEVGVRDLGEPGVGVGDGIEVLAMGFGGVHFYAGIIQGGNIQVHVEDAD